MAGTLMVKPLQPAQVFLSGGSSTARTAIVERRMRLKRWTAVRQVETSRPTLLVATLAGRSLLRHTCSAGSRDRRPASSR